MAVACFVCPDCGYHDIAGYVVLAQPCPGCGSPAEVMGLVQCGECGDPLVPSPDWTQWEHGADRWGCLEFEPLMLPGMRVRVSLRGTNAYARVEAVGGQVGFVGIDLRFEAPQAANVPDQATLRLDGGWRLRGRIRTWGRVVAVPRRPRA